MKLIKVALYRKHLTSCNQLEPNHTTTTIITTICENVNHAFYKTKYIHPRQSNIDLAVRICALLLHRVHRMEWIFLSESIVLFTFNRKKKKKKDCACAISSAFVCSCFGCGQMVIRLGTLFVVVSTYMYSIYVNVR